MYGDQLSSYDADSFTGYSDSYFDNSAGSNELAGSDEIRLPADDGISVSGGDGHLYYLLSVDPRLEQEDVDTALLQSIDYKLSFVVFFLLASWTIARIRNAVRSFTGRSVPTDPDGR